MYTSFVDIFFTADLEGVPCPFVATLLELEIECYYGDRVLQYLFTCTSFLHVFKCHQYVYVDDTDLMTLSCPVLNVPVHHQLSVFIDL